MISLERRKRLDSHARTYVVGNGKKLGHEYLTGYCLDTGKVLGRHTDESHNSVSIPKKISRHLVDKKRKCILHHNHPGGTSLSREDLVNVAKLPGTRNKFAHGHENQWYQAENLRIRNLEDILLEADLYFMRVLKYQPALAGRVFKDLRNHIFNIGLHKAKVIRYSFKLSKASQLTYDKIPLSDIETLVKAVTSGVSSMKGAPK